MKVDYSNWIKRTRRWEINKRFSRSAFTLLEVIVALAMLALIAVPAVGLATMAVSRGKQQLASNRASDIKVKVDTALRAYQATDLFDATFLPNDTEWTFWVSEDLKYIEKADTTLSDDNDKYYQVVLMEPEGYNYSAGTGFRLIVYEITWPYNTNVTTRNQLFFTSVFRK